MNYTELRVIKTRFTYKASENMWIIQDKVQDNRER